MTIPAFVLSISLFLFAMPAFAQAPTPPAATDRIVTPLTTGWKYLALPDKSTDTPEKPGFDDSQWASETLPHTWNRRGYYTTHRNAWYRVHFALPATDKDRELYVCFDGAATIADVYLNGKFLGEHRGAFTRFNFDATPFAVVGGDNVLAVKIDNTRADTYDCLPSGYGYQLYHVYGGLYRPAHLLLTAKVHVDPTNCASSGLYITPENVTPDSADALIKTLVRNDTDTPQTVTVQDTLTGPTGQTVTTLTGNVTVAAHNRDSVTLTAHIPHPALWGPGHPALYSVTTETQLEGQTTDTVTERTGFRYFSMTMNAFTLNGVSTPLRGVSKHQETEEHASALTDADIDNDWAEMQTLGVNYVRLAHYPHAQREYDDADQDGIVVWAENGHSNAGPPTTTGEQITREMVLQNYNHPSIVFWSVGNEAIMQDSDVETLEDYANIVRGLDTTRYITYASDTYFDEDPALDFVAVNRYNGWYGGTIWSFTDNALYYHWISETGAGGVVSTHASQLTPTHRVDKFEPEEYQDLVTEQRCQLIFRNSPDEIPLFTWWTFRDFNDPRDKGYNTKGLLTAGNFPKDAYYIFQSYLRPNLPVVHLCGKTWFVRRGNDGTGIKAYSNAAQLTLTINGKVIGTQTNGNDEQFGEHPVDNVFYWPAPTQPGTDTITVDDGAGHTDSAVWLYLGRHNELGPDSPTSWVQHVSSSNRHNPAYAIDTPIQPEWPFYDDFDGSGDNTFHDIPPILAGSHWVTTGRLSKSGSKTTIGIQFRANTGPMDVFVMLTPGKKTPTFLTGAGFVDTGVTGTWRNNDMNLVPYALYRKTVPAGGRIHIPGAPEAVDYVVLVKPSAAPLAKSAPSPARAVHGQKQRTRLTSAIARGHTAQRHHKG
jgi:beta-galactosidase